MGVQWTILTPTGSPGAVSGILLSAPRADELDQALANCGFGPIAVGEVRLRKLLGIDDGLVARWTGHAAELMPHGGIAVLRAVIRALNQMGFVEARSVDPEVLYPEARDIIEANMLRTLARAQSPAAVDLIIEHAARCRRGEPPAHPDDSARLGRLIEPALVVAVGPANVGKSTLINRLAGRHVAIVADEPGTTRDHVGVMLELDGVVVRYLDTPGLRDGGDATERVAGLRADELARSAELLLLCGDRDQAPMEPRWLSTAGTTCLRVCLRGDLGRPEWNADIIVSALAGDGVSELQTAVAEALVPARARNSPGAWRFWE